VDEVEVIRNGRTNQFSITLVRGATQYDVWSRWPLEPERAVMAQARRRVDHALRY
jgi:hypothetical protein